MSWAAFSWSWLGARGRGLQFEVPAGMQPGMWDVRQWQSATCDMWMSHVARLNGRGTQD